MIPASVLITSTDSQSQHRNPYGCPCRLPISDTGMGYCIGTNNQCHYSVSVIGIATVTRQYQVLSIGTSPYYKKIQNTRHTLDLALLLVLGVFEVQHTCYSLLTGSSLGPVPGPGLFLLSNWSWSWYWVSSRSKVLVVLSYWSWSWS